jgi:hypothetical protein
MVLDVRKTVGLSPVQRKMITSGVEGDEERLKKYCHGMALVFDSPALKRLLTAIFWVKRPVVPMKVFTDTESALDWAKSQVKDEKEAAPSEASHS